MENVQSIGGGPNTVDPAGRKHSAARHQPRGKPQNPRLYDMVTNLAKRKFRVYPSIAANKWIHDEYVKRGGRFVASKKDDDQHIRRKLPKGRDKGRPDKDKVDEKDTRRRGGVRGAPTEDDKKKKSGKKK